MLELNLIVEPDILHIVERAVLKGKNRCNTFHIDDLIDWFSTPSLSCSNMKDQLTHKKGETQSHSHLEKITLTVES